MGFKLAPKPPAVRPVKNHWTTQPSIKDRSLSSAMSRRVSFCTMLLYKQSKVSNRVSKIYSSHIPEDPTKLMKKEKNLHQLMTKILQRNGIKL